ncbi:MAG TPA: acyl-CoA reductase [Bacteroidetes bacterium]|nr:acyl-CoA reductase [Bacteroidota bacterium]
MQTLHKRIRAFTDLGLILADAASPDPSSSEAVRLRRVMDNQQQKNKWFTPDNVIRSVKAIANMLREDKLLEWLGKYNIADEPPFKKTIAVIMAGNIPLVGFHDFLCVLISGNNLLAHTSSKDSELIRVISEMLIALNYSFSDKISLSGKISPPYDAVIATGSNNTSRYFEYYFGDKPHIFRKNRNSIAIIDRQTDEKSVRNLALDIFTYFGLGCRNVSKIYFEDGTGPDKIISHLSDWQHIIQHRPYANNYVYNKSLFNLNKQAFLDSGFMLFKKDSALASPVSVTYYDFFSKRDELLKELGRQAGMIQCIVSENDLPFGLTQYPGPGEYADNVDTLAFLTSL